MEDFGSNMLKFSLNGVLCQDWNPDMVGALSLFLLKVDLDVAFFTWEV